MNITICTPYEYDDLVDIFIEMETYYNQKLCLSRNDMAAYLRDKVFAADSNTEVHKVVCNGVIAAFACVSVMYPAPRFSGQMFIKELFVSASYRRAGIGRKLMGFIASRAQERGCFQLDWLSVAADPLAQKFYESLGAQVIKSVNYHRVFGQKINELARNAG
ncbi:MULTISPECIES: N-acetyltransferase [unclassified Leclercia]|uniref:GNAT family N-acetyltransferase n=1 Tax=Leclercia barmai TaxID=2785629 RepID=A0ABS7RYP7_9ENTR|nr:MULTISPECIES: N-acetyltransferase [unclassified Leclercia]MBZ0059429.1 GNAT family N-acetyltransferase [Leclercia sp. EMC7]MCM5697438.1 GNAT family N-acetyltransferase [Leclercia sp. LTM01]MCM5701969.1 GNAT family N-acetyltransferase [Leclercia sp. LTM14]